MYPALLPLMRTPRLPVVDRTDTPADINRLVRFAERRNLVSALVPSHFRRSLRGGQNGTTASLFSTAFYLSVFPFIPPFILTQISPLFIRVPLHSTIHPYPHFASIYPCSPSFHHSSLPTFRLYLSVFLFIPPFILTHISPPHSVLDSPERAAHNHNPFYK